LLGLGRIANRARKRLALSASARVLREFHVMKSFTSSNWRTYTLSARRKVSA
jgi:hypothetical protein